MKKMSGLDWVALILLIVGGINWGLIGLLKFDLVKAVFGAWPALIRIIYILVGLSGLYVLASAGKMGSEPEQPK